MTPVAIVLGLIACITRGFTAGLGPTNSVVANKEIGRSHLPLAAQGLRVVIRSQHGAIRLLNQAVKFVILRESSVCHPLVNEAQSMRHCAELFVQPVALLFT